MQAPPGFILPTGSARGQTLTVLGQTVIERLTAEDSPGWTYVFDQITPPRMGVPPHSHSREDEVVLIRAGLFEVFLNGTVARAGPGCLLNFARGSLHGFRVIGDAPGETTWIVTPGLGFQVFLRALGLFPPGPPDMARLDALHGAQGITIAPPTDPWW